MIQTWHKWFAWYPVRIRPGGGVLGPLVWLKTIERDKVVVHRLGEWIQVKFYRECRERKP